jgi:uncharacterized membrane protein YadS
MLGARDEAPTSASRPALRRTVLPAFVLGFLSLVVVRTIGDGVADGSAAWSDVLAAGQLASEWLLLVGMAAIGLGITFSHLRDAGWRPVATAFGAALLAGAAALGWCLVAAAW